MSGLDSNVTHVPDPSFGPLATVQAEDAHAAATRDREASADLTLGLAVREAIDLIRSGQPGRAEYRLARAEQSARRILGESRPPGGAS